MHAIRCLGTALIALPPLLAGCISPGTIGPKSQATDPATLRAERTLEGVRLSPAAWPQRDWWKDLGDPQLDALIDEALAANPTLSAARARIDASLGSAMVARAKLGATNSLDAGITRQRNSSRGASSPNLSGRTYTDYRVAWHIGYDVDWWGRDRAALEAALGRVKAAEADAAAARLELSAEIARAYVQWAHDHDQLEIARKALALREAALKLSQERAAAGLDSRIDTAWTESEIAALRGRMAQYDEVIAHGRNRLAALIARGPDRGLDIQPPRLPALAETALPSNLPAELVGRRPDLVAARWRIEASSKDIDAAKAAFYPNINLAAFIGLQALGVNDLLRSGSHIFGFGPAVSLPLYGGGTLRGQLTERSGEHDLAVEHYNHLLVEALRDVADQVVALRSIDAQREEFEQGLASARTAHELVLTRFRSGLSARLVVVGAESQLLDREVQLAQLRARRLDTFIGLMRALGGGFQDAGPQATAEAHP